MNRLLSFDVAIIGSGILGLAHAFEALNRGFRVILFERDHRPLSASIRNFGMLWPVGQAPGPALNRALRSREIWLKAATAAGFWTEMAGSIHVAHADDEWAVLQEFESTAERHGYRVRLLTAGECVKHSPSLNTLNLRGGMLSSTEVCVDPRDAVAKLLLWVRGHQNATVRTATPIKSIEDSTVVATSGDRWRADRIIVCSGADLSTLYPEVYQDSGLIPCKLQMMRTVAQPNGWRLGPMLAGGATLRHYRAFEGCPSLAQVRARFTHERPIFDRYGIHVMASQNEAGEVAIGDSHVYGDEIDPFDADHIDSAVLEYLATLILLPTTKIMQRWHGVYAKLRVGHEYVASPQPGVRIVNGPGGAGMTMSFGAAFDTFESWPNQ
jgi:D-hydroxyproline dehydrogenase subunit beta